MACFYLVKALCNSRSIVDIGLVVQRNINTWLLFSLMLCFTNQYRTVQCLRVFSILCSSVISSFICHTLSYLIYDKNNGITSHDTSTLLPYPRLHIMCNWKYFKTIPWCVHLMESVT